MKQTKIKLKLIRLDGGTQPRAAIDQDVVADYAEKIKAGQDMPPVVLFHDGADYWLADGFHRFHAATDAGQADINAEVRTGGKRQAVLYSVGANASHGLRRSNADKRKAVQTLLADEEWAKWSDRKIAEACNVDHKTVAEVRKSHTGEIPSMERTFTHHKTGKPATMDTSNIGRTADAHALPAGDTQGDDEAWPDQTPAPESKAPAKTRQQAKPHLDEVGNQIPDHLSNVFASNTLANFQSLIQQARAALKNSADPQLAQVEFQRMDIDLKNVWEAAKFARPYAVCMHHRGKACAPCKGTGWLVKTSYDRLPSEQRAVKK